jgi:hypothetical protein
MILFKQIELLQRVHKLITQSSTGNPKVFSGQLGISPRRLHEILDEMKAMGAPVSYSRKSETYYYEEDFEMNISYSFRRLSPKEQEKISGGCHIFLKIFFTACFVQ